MGFDTQRLELLLFDGSTPSFCSIAFNPQLREAAMAYPVSSELWDKEEESAGTSGGERGAGPDMFEIHDWRVRVFIHSKIWLPSNSWLWGLYWYAQVCIWVYLQGNVALSWNFKFHVCAVNPLIWFVEYYLSIDMFSKCFCLMRSFQFRFVLFSICSSDHLLTRPCTGSWKSHESWVSN